MIITKLNGDKDEHRHLEKEQFSFDVSRGLKMSPKKISSKYFYDTKGSRLFQEITKLKEYYLTRAELSILLSIRDVLPKVVGRNEIDMVELGVGDGHKTKVLIDSFLEKKIKVNFYPIDISEEAFGLLEKNIAVKPNLKIHGIVGEYIEGLHFARRNSKNRQIVLFLGSNIGNFDALEREAILKEIQSALNKDDFLLIGFDLKKNLEMMNRAYSDSAGVTARFNLNLLERINSELGANFNLSSFVHKALFNPKLNAMESHLVSTIAQDVFIKDLNELFHFDAHEVIHLEYSFKYTEEEIRAMSARGGFNHVCNFSDANKFFIDSLWQV